MKKADVSYVIDCIESEGFEYAFRHYTDFKKVKDTQFHKLRKEFCAAADKLEKYVKFLKEEASANEEEV